MAKATMSIDWEDFGQLYGKYHYGDVTPPVNNAIERQTNIILDLLDETGNKATFFILGILASYKPALVKQIAARGHEIALHGQRHEAMYTLTPDKAKEDIATSQKIVTDITGEAVHGYRAPFFSVKKENLYLLETLAELGLIYDSSIFPVALSRYGIADFSPDDKLYSLPGGKQIVELPLSVGKLLGKHWPVSGGGYIRLMPSFLVEKIFRSFSAKQKDSMIYMHPYEFDTQRLEVSSNHPENAGFSRIKLAALNFRWNIFRATITPKLRKVLAENDFSTCLEKALSLKSQQPLPLSFRY